MTCCLRQVPADGVVTFSVQPGGNILFSAPVEQDTTLGSATVSFEQPAPQQPSYGEYTSARRCSCLVAAPAPACMHAGSMAPFLHAEELLLCAPLAQQQLRPTGPADAMLATPAEVTSHVLFISTVFAAWIDQVAH